MNIALPTVIIIILILPGLAFRRFYYTEEFSKQYFKQSPFEIFFAGFFPSIIFHLFWVMIIPKFGYNVDFEILGRLFTSKDFYKEGFSNIQKNIGAISLYQITILFFSVTLGISSKFLVRKLKLDRKRKLFRFQNHWHYIIKGEFIEFRRTPMIIKDKVEDIALFYVDALVETSEGSILYEGILVDYELSKDGGLEQITLTEVVRRYLKKDAKDTSNDTDRWVPIAGHLLVIPYSQIKNLNFSYYKTLIQQKEIDGAKQYSVSVAPIS